MKVEVISASAGTGKTWRLSHDLDALLDRSARPEGVVAITYTTKAAGELESRIRSALLEKGRADLAACCSIETSHGRARRLALNDCDRDPRLPQRRLDTGTMGLASLTHVGARVRSPTIPDQRSTKHSRRGAGLPRFRAAVHRSNSWSSRSRERYLLLVPCSVGLRRLPSPGCTQSRRRKT